jgi:hypothetical protein
VFALDLMSAYEGEHMIFGLLGQANHLFFCWAFGVPVLVLGFGWVCHLLLPWLQGVTKRFKFLHWLLVFRWRCLQVFLSDRSTMLTHLYTKGHWIMLEGTGVGGGGVGAEDRSGKVTVPAE